MSHVVSWHFWFEPSLPTNLAVSRVLFFTGLLVFYWNEDFSAWGSVSRAFWMPVPAFEALHLSPLSTGALAIVQPVWRAAVALSAIGLFTRASMCIAFALGFYLLGLPHNFGHVYHFDALLVITMGVLACSRAGDAWSIDRWRAGGSPPAPSGEYTWPIRVVWLAMSLVFLAAGLSKLRHGGVEWVMSENMSIVLMRAAYHVSDADPLTTFGLWIAARPWLARTVAFLALSIELAFVATLFSARARAVLVPAAIAMLVGIRVLMGPTFGGFLIANVFWVPWDAVGARLAAWIGRSTRKPQNPQRVMRRTARSVGAGR
jgi:hypothetical protein